MERFDIFISAVEKDIRARTQPSMIAECISMLRYHLLPGVYERRSRVSKRLDIAMMFITAGHISLNPHIYPESHFPENLNLITLQALLSKLFPQERCNQVPVMHASQWDRRHTASSTSFEASKKSIGIGYIRKQVTRWTSKTYGSTTKSMISIVQKLHSPG